MALDKIMSSCRTAAVTIIAVVGIVALSFLCVLLIRLQTSRGEPVVSTAATLIGCLIFGGLLIYLCCMLTYHAFSYWRKATLSKAIRISEAMHEIQAHMHHEKMDDIKRYSIKIFKTKKILQHGVTENVDCNEVSTFLSPMFFNIDRLSAFGSPYYCCDFEQIQTITASNKAKWGGDEKRSGETAEDVIALERRLADMNEKYKSRTKEYTAASGREGLLKKQMEEVESHMAVLVELANKVTNEVKPPRNITEDGIRTKYLAIGKIYGISKVPGAYVDIFRNNMPKEIINWGGAPKQGSVNEET